MEKTYFVGESFSKPQSLQSGEYEDCVFQKAELESQDLTGCKFVDCVFDVFVCMTDFQSTQKNVFSQCHSARDAPQSQARPRAGLRRGLRPAGDRPS